MESNGQLRLQLVWRSKSDGQACSLKLFSCPGTSHYSTQQYSLAACPVDSKIEVLFDASKVAVLELTICHESNILKSRLYKLNKYSEIKSHLSPKFFSHNIQLYTAEISVLGFIFITCQISVIIRLSNLPNQIKPNIRLIKQSFQVVSIYVVVETLRTKNSKKCLFVWSLAKIYCCTSLDNLNTGRIIYTYNNFMSYYSM